MDDSFLIGMPITALLAWFDISGHDYRNSSESKSEKNKK